MSALADLLAQQLSAAGLAFEREVRFHPVRRWRFDFLFTPSLACEVDGGTWSGGRHTRGAGFEKDAEKLNEAALLGFTVLRFTGSMVRDGRALQTITRALEATG
ncbi:hypothetical protein [Deinococcus sp.]|uniref:hypothetical protein n=1 Tax=Deinococcus sp. TaxID=47478 RepID=UPI0025F9DF9E|nr:hypothetical protein [Deinococcus sp.]